VSDLLDLLGGFDESADAGAESVRADPVPKVEAREFTKEATKMAR
jgi:hypothetical protein